MTRRQTVVISLTNDSNPAGDRQYVTIRLRGETNIEIRMSLEDYALASTGMVAPCEVVQK